MNAVVLAIAVLIDRFVGDPPWIWRRVPHPVVGFGHAISRAEWWLNRPAWPERQRRMAGIAAILVLMALAAAVGWAITTALAGFGFLGLLLTALVASVFLAQKSLADHVERVGTALDQDGLEAGRLEVSMIVGRDPADLDEPAVRRAAIESLAENASDGVVAPWLALALFGLPGLLAYKMLNTADSMIGHMDERHRAFGYGAARLDDLANWPAARLTALLFAVAALLRRGRASAQRALSVASRDARTHRSPNAGWPESAMAGALDLALGGPRRYGTVAVDAPMLNAGGRREADGQHLRRALQIFATLCDLVLGVSFLLAIAAVL
ncbi:adenosylcobinamide-phosphate synthase CbiB [Aureimonas sp. AU12]|uniref:adenosylcobinamide-phosphate synthase CbiB n=1 Tax=Aureimonas sp. AU12 TaxID=1638161 RepID=UPI0007810DB2|nr:adenosylcobinamide-phosphate synthase CbiB [Aureimonas sp. AU12]